MGEDTWRRRHVAVHFIVAYFCRQNVLTMLYSISSAYDPRCAHTIPPGLSQVTSRRIELNTSGRSDRPILRLAALGLAPLLFHLLRILADCIRRWPRLGADEAEQTQVDRTRSATPGLARCHAETERAQLDKEAACREDGKGLLL